MSNLRWHIATIGYTKWKRIPFFFGSQVVSDLNAFCPFQGGRELCLYERRVCRLDIGLLACSRWQEEGREIHVVILKSLGPAPLIVWIHLRKYCTDTSRFKRSHSWSLPWSGRLGRPRANQSVLSFAYGLRWRLQRVPPVTKTNKAASYRGRISLWYVSSKYFNLAVLRLHFVPGVDRGLLFVGADL